MKGRYIEPQAGKMPVKHLPNKPLYEEKKEDVIAVQERFYTRWSRLNATQSVRD